MRDPQQYIDAVCDYFGVKQEALLSESRAEPLPNARKILIYLLRDLPSREVARLVNRSAWLVYHYITQMNYQMDSESEIRTHVLRIQNITEKQMNLKLSHAQLKALWEMLADFGTMKAEGLALELICLLIDEIQEKARKRVRADKANISLDEKQLRAFVLWYEQFAPIYQTRHPYGYSTLLDMIQQIKPLQHGKTLTLRH